MSSTSQSKAMQALHGAKAAATATFASQQQIRPHSLSVANRPTRCGYEHATVGMDNPDRGAGCCCCCYWCCCWRRVTAIYAGSVFLIQLRGSNRWCSEQVDRVLLIRWGLGLEKGGLISTHKTPSDLARPSSLAVSGDSIPSLPTERLQCNVTGWTSGHHHAPCRV